VRAAKRGTGSALDIYFVPYFTFAGFGSAAQKLKYQNSSTASSILPVSCGSRDFGCRVSFPPAVQKNSRDSADCSCLPAALNSQKLEIC
jgi:hypothetical protein